MKTVIAVDAMGGDHGPAVTVPACLDFLAAHPTESFTLSELSRRLGINGASAHAVLTELTEAGYLEWSYVARMAPVMLESQFDADARARAALAPDHRKVPR